jgi:hypothetical protein
MSWVIPLSTGLVEDTITDLKAGDVEAATRTYPNAAPDYALYFDRTGKLFKEFHVSWLSKVLSLVGGGIGGTDAATAKVALGIDGVNRLAIQNKGAVDITGGIVIGSGVGLSGNGIGITGINATNFSSGTIDAARLSIVPGAIKQIVSTTQLMTTALINNTTNWIDPISKAITPLSASSKILILASIPHTVDAAAGTSNGCAFRILRYTGATPSTIVTWGAGSGIGGYRPAGKSTIQGFNLGLGFLMFSDFPNTTAIRTYSIQFTNLAAGGTTTIPLLGLICIFLIEYE